MNLRNNTLALSIMAAAALAACDGIDVGGSGSKEGKALDQEQTVTVDVDATGVLNLANSFGNITVIGEADRAEINMVPTLNSDDPNAGTIAVYTEDGTAYVAVAGSADISVDVTVYTPKNLDFTVATGGGALDLSGMSGGGDVATGDGDASLDLELTSDLTVTTGQGNISLSIPSDTAASLDGAAAGGSIDIDSSFGLSDEYGTGVVSGDINGGGSISISLTTGGGDISVNAQ